MPLDAEDVNTPQFPYNWQKAEGDAPFVLELTCRGLQLVLKDSGSPDFGPALVTVDGGEPLRYDPRDAGWTHCHATVLLDEPEARPHRIEIRMAPRRRGQDLHDPRLRLGEVKSKRIFCQNITACYSPKILFYKEDSYDP